MLCHERVCLRPHRQLPRKSRLDHNAPDELANGALRPLTEPFPVCFPLSPPPAPPSPQVIHNLEEYGNTSAGSIPLALSETVASGKIKKGDVIACAGFGAGLSWGSTVMRWG